MFKRTNEITLNPTDEILQSQREGARDFILETIPHKRECLVYEHLKLETAKRFIVSDTDMNKICKALRNEKHD